MFYKVLLVIGDKSKNFLVSNFNNIKLKDKYIKFIIVLTNSNKFTHSNFGYKINYGHESWTTII